MRSWIDGLVVALNRKGELAESQQAILKRIEGVEQKAGRVDRFTTLADAIEDFQKRSH